ncbi:fatty acid desaturase family protein [Singulisphaera sp. PoT]|uniref:fatty acid desaturase family protein n=1 Tax=Singulisphaera sp. PoT TaxID=3411797 RepID=UPI003BF4E4A6
MSVTMPSAARRPAFNAPELQEEIMRLRAVDNWTNLGYLASEYLCIAAVMASAIVFSEFRASWGVSWWFNVPVMAVAIVLIGAMQHRLAGLGHEAAHYTLLKNKFCNDLVGDFFCMFPITATVHFYRLFHLAHHQYTNDPSRDPDLVSLGGSKMVDRFPMGRWEFIKSIYLRAFTEPKALLKYQQDYFDINVIGRSESVYLQRSQGETGGGRRWPRLGATLGIIYLAAFVATQQALFAFGLSRWLWLAGLAGTAVVLSVGLLLPVKAYFPSPFRQPYSSRTSGLLRLVYYTWFFVGFGMLRTMTGGASVAYIWLLWIVPLMSTFSFFMLLRDVYQHTNADDGRLTNSRVFFADPFTRWAVFVYGQDMHIPHHLFPAVPHYRLPFLHKLLKSRHHDYATQVVECHGTFVGRDGHPTILDELTEPLAERQEKRRTQRGEG